MTARLQMILVVILIVGLVAIINMVKRRSLELKYVLAWIFCLIMLLIFSLIPDTMTALAKFLGIYSPVNMIFFLGFVFFVIIIFTLTVSLSRTTERVRKLAQVLALENDNWKTESADKKNSSENKDNTDSNDNTNDRGECQYQEMEEDFGG